MRLAQVRPSSIKLALKQPGTDLPLGITLHLVGRDSPQFQAYATEVHALRDQAEADGVKFDAAEVGRKHVTTCVVGCDEPDAFKLSEDDDGAYTPEKLNTLLKTGEYGWLVEQVMAAINKRDAFFVGSLTSSVSA